MTHLSSVWDAVLERLRTELPDFAYVAWIRPLAAVESPGALDLLAPSAFHRARVESKLLDEIRRLACDVAGGDLAVRIAVRASSAEAGAPLGLAGGLAPASGARASSASAPALRTDAESEAPQRAAAPREPLVAVPKPARREEPAPGPGTRQAPLPYTFEEFVVGPANALAREASVAVAQGRRLGAGPLLIVSDTGNGKTHLARALHGKLRRAHRDRAVYVSAEAFTNDLLRSIRGRETASFKRRYRQDCELLVIEDVQFFAGKEASQLELFHTLEHLRSVGTPVVLTADRLPRDIDGLEPRVGSQIASGLVAEIEAPDATLRREILRAKAAAGGVRLPDPCLERLVDEVRGSVRDLEGVLIQLVQSAALLKRPIDVELTERALRKVASQESGAPAGLSVERVVATVAASVGLRPAELRSRSRRRAVLLPRQLAMYLCRRYTDASLAEIGRALGRDHPSVRNAVAVVERGILERAPLRYQVEELAQRLESLRR